MRNWRCKQLMQQRWTNWWHSYLGVEQIFLSVSSSVSESPWKMSQELSMDSLQMLLKKNWSFKSLVVNYYKWCKTYKGTLQSFDDWFSKYNYTSYCFWRYCSMKPPRRGTYLMVYKVSNIRQLHERPSSDIASCQFCRNIVFTPSAIYSLLQ